MEATGRPRRGAPPKGEPTARERILATAGELFYREGIRAIGVDTVAERAGVSKTSLYRQFESKDALIAAFASGQDQAYWQWWDGLEERYAQDPHALLEALLSGIAKRIARRDFRGCPFLNLLTEFPDDEHPGRRVAARHKSEMQTRLIGLCGRLGAAEPDRAGSQLALVINGAYASGGVSTSRNLKEDLVDAAGKLLGQPR
ncbi:TetR family transcriptional regulator [Mycolicibacterium anyangense]|uniref:TetR family transcriptional regulator n=1 Tax=Mycolicibacterium anyangense TaxID=1431246 RepID=A0A6N4WEY5_9MYCO|nr:TetR/AcrR family transcriptional regulator [Mycolicibacterium anyangense]BBZ78654.1 TetR family transcriptional regulator [Mycolicibacterium anyangense]